MASLAAPPVFRLVGRDGARLDLAAAEGERAHIFVLEEDIVRLVVLPSGLFSMARTWAVGPGGLEPPWEGRDRFDVTGFSCPPFKLDESGETLIAETARLRLTIALAGLRCRWEMRDPAGAWTPIARDRPTQAYNFSWWDEKVYHHLARAKGERYFGLGERTGPLDRAGRRFRLQNVDALGYDAARTDPLYKHIPLAITLTAQNAAFGLFYDTYSDCEFDFGATLDSYHGPFRSFIAEQGDLDLYVIAGPRVADVTRRFTWLTGRPALPPRWALGYSGSSMAYTEAPDAQARVTGFAEACAAHDVLCNSFHLSSGYTTIGEKRCVFHWNRDRFPDPEGWLASFAAKGLHVLANVKPCLLRGHPEFDAAWDAGVLMRDADGAPAWAQFWGDVGAYLDFTAPQTAAWWKAHLRSALLDKGVSGAWNDNNEFEIWSATAQAHGFGAPFPARAAKPLQTLLMVRASCEAQAEHAPEARPFLISRAGAAGMQRYVQTWSGDNATSWETLRNNFKMSQGLALSGVSNSGHDVGGFSGPAPSPELFVRWVQACLLDPRFSIHSWREDGSVNAPWMFPEMTALVRDLIAWRYRFIPYLYDLLWRHHSAFEPVVRPLFHDFPDDPNCLEDDDSAMIGPLLLSAPVFEDRLRERKVYFPAGAAWRDLWTGARYEGGAAQSVPAPLERPPLFAREGAAIPLNVAEQHFARPADRRAFLVFPPREGTMQGVCFEDDGWSRAAAAGRWGEWRLRLRSEADRLVCAIDRAGLRPPEANELDLWLPADERRAIVCAAAEATADKIEGSYRRVTLRRA
jgi:alpha-glucosidase